MNGRVIQAIGDSFLAREGLSETVQPWEDGLRADTGPGFFEWWYFDAHLADGSTAVVIFATKPLLRRRGPLMPNLSLTITRPDGHKLSQFPIYPADQFSASQQGCDVRIGPNWVRGDLQRYELHAESGDLAADLVFTGSVPPWRPGAGKNYYDPALRRYFAWLPAIPYGTVSGTLTYDGQTHPVSGNGYHDHNWGNVDLPEVLSHWYWGRARLGDFTLIFVEMVSTRKYGNQKLPVFLLAQGERILAGDGAPLTLETADFRKHPQGREYPLKLDFDWHSPHGRVSLALRQPQVIEATSLLGMLPPFKRALASLFTNPYYFRFNAALELSIDLGEVHVLERGETLYELMLLR